MKISKYKFGQPVWYELPGDLTLMTGYIKQVMANEKGIFYRIHDNLTDEISEYDLIIHEEHLNPDFDHIRSSVEKALFPYDKGDEIVVNTERRRAIVKYSISDYGTPEILEICEWFEDRKSYISDEIDIHIEDILGFQFKEDE